MVAVSTQRYQRRVPLDSHEDVIEVMGNPAGQRADGFHLLGLLELGFKALRLGNVTDNRDHPNDFPFFK
jgi:hypothetical protein